MSFRLVYIIIFQVTGLRHGFMGKGGGGKKGWYKVKNKIIVDNKLQSML